MIRRLLISLLVLSAAAGASLAGSYATGANYRAMSPAERTAYVMAAADMMDRMASELDNADAKAFIERANRCTANMTGAQLRDFVDAYMAQDPKYGEYSMVSNIRAALHEKCPQ